MYNLFIDSAETLVMLICDLRCFSASCSVYILCVCVLGILEYSDDTAMARCVVQSLLTRAGFDEQDMARRYMNALF